MPYLLSFLEGVITFVSPCLLPLLPVYFSYLAGQKEDHSLLKNASGFVLGFSGVFVVMGAFAGSLGAVLLRYQQVVNLATGLAVVLLGLNYLGVLQIPFLNRTAKPSLRKVRAGFLSSLLFGVIFSVGWTPCVGTFLGSALMLAAGSANPLGGVFLLLAYSAGLGLPFLFSALLLDRFKEGFAFIRRHYTIINALSGVFLILIGILMMTGLFGRLLSALNF